MLQDHRTMMMCARPRTAFPALEVFALKERYGAAIVAQSHQTALSIRSITDFTGDSLELARFASRTECEIIVVCGARHMAETVKLLCPEKRVLAVLPEVGCPLAESITADDVQQIRARCPGIPVIAYVNTSAAVKAEADICCTTANAIAVTRSVGSETVILLPDRHLAELVAQGADVEVIAWHGACDAQCDGVRMITFDNVARALRELTEEIQIDAEIAERARQALARMLAATE